MPNVYEQVKQALQDVVAPEIRELKVEIRRLDEKIDSMDKRLNERINSLDNKIDFALEFRERLTALETKMATLSR